MLRRRWLREVAKLREQRDYGEALAQIATLRPAVDAFFDKVMVLDPDADGARSAPGTDRRSAARILWHCGLQRDCDFVVSRSDAGAALSEGLPGAS